MDERARSEAVGPAKERTSLPKMFAGARGCDNLTARRRAAARGRFQLLGELRLIREVAPLTARHLGQAGGEEAEARLREAAGRRGGESPKVWQLD